MIRFGTYNIKGGVGKTSATINLAYLASRDGYRTLVWDLDPQGASSFYLQANPRKIKGGERVVDRKKHFRAAIRSTAFELLDIIPADLGNRHLDLDLNERKKPLTRVARLLDSVADDYDVVFLDCSPSLSVVSENVFAAADCLLIPIIPTPLSVRAYEQLIEFFENSGRDPRRLLPFFSMVDRRKKLHRDLVVDFARHHDEVLRSYIPYSSDIERMGVEQAPIGSFAARGPGGRAFASLWDAIQLRVGTGT